MNITQKFLTKNRCYTKNQKIAVKGLMIHSIGTPQPSAQVLIDSWNNPSVSCCVHAFIDGNTGKVFQTLPWEHRGWHAGSKANNTHIGVEMCEPNTIKYKPNSAIWTEQADGTNTKAVVLRTYKSAVKLFAYLCKEFDLNPLEDGVVISHAEGYKRGIATNHGDVEHLWEKHGLTMDGFRNDIAAAMHDVADEPKEFKPYLIKVTVKDFLNIRKGAGTDTAVVGKIAGKDLIYNYTIVAEAEGKGASKWGKLKSGAGWISLDYTKKI